jgi:hypothetical protein
MGCDFVDLTAELLVLVEHWPVGFLLSEVATVVVGDIQRLCHDRDCLLIFGFGGGSKAIDFPWKSKFDRFVISICFAFADQSVVERLAIG